MHHIMLKYVNCCMCCRWDSNFATPAPSAGTRLHWSSARCCRRVLLARAPGSSATLLGKLRYLHVQLSSVSQCISSPSRQHTSNAPAIYDWQLSCNNSSSADMYSAGVLVHVVAEWSCMFLSISLAYVLFVCCGRGVKSGGLEWAGQNWRGDVVIDAWASI